MKDVYAVNLIPCCSRRELWLTVDYKDGEDISCDVVKKYKTTDKLMAEIDLVCLRKKHKIKENDMKRSSALTKNERKWVHECMKKNKEYQSILLKSRIDNKQLNDKEMK